MKTFVRLLYLFILSAAGFFSLYAAVFQSESARGASGYSVLALILFTMALMSGGE